MKKTFLVKLLACLMAACLVFAGCSADKAPDEGKVMEEVVKDVHGLLGNSESSLFSKAFSAINEKSEKFYDLDYENLSIDAEAKFTLGEAFGDFVDLMSGSNMSSQIDAFGVKSAKITAAFDRNDDLYAINADAYINDSFVADANAVFDYDGKMLYVALPELVKDFLGVDASELVDSIEYELGDFAEMYSAQIEAQKELTEGLEKYLSDEEILAILEDYAKTGEAELGEPEVEDTEISVDDVSQKVKAYTYEIDSNKARNLIKVIFEKLYDDEEIKEKFLAVYPLIFDYFDVISGGEFSYYAEEDAEVIYDEFLSEVEDVLDNLDDIDGDEVLTVTVYYANDAFSGFTFEMEEEISFDFLSVRDGNDVAACICVDDGYDEASMKLVGNDKGDMYNGVLSIENADIGSVSVKIEDFDLKKFAEGSISMTLAMYAEDMPAISNSVPEGFAVKLGLDSDNLTYCNFCFAVENDGVNVFDIDLDISFSDDADKVAVPSDFVDIEDENAITAWSQNILGNVSVIIENLKNAGIPEEIIGMLVANFMA